MEVFKEAGVSMNRKLPRPFEIYRHFKGKDYQIICMARDADTGEDIVVYQALYGDYACYTRPLSQFLSETDREKYPDAAQTQRFQEISAPEEKEAAEACASVQVSPRRWKSQSRGKPTLPCWHFWMRILWKKNLISWFPSAIGLPTDS